MRRKTVIKAIHRALLALRKTKPILKLAFVTALTKFLAACTDTTSTDEDDHLVGGKEADLFVSSLGADTFDGAEGIDVVDYSNSNGAVVAYLDGRVGKGYFSEGDVIANIENLVGSNYNDVLIGNDRDNEIIGLDGNDIIVGGRGADVLKGGNGVDLLDYSLSESGITFSFVSGLGTGGHVAGDITTGFENLIATQYNDKIEGNALANKIEAGRGDDVINGGAGDDVIIGGQGRDTLNGDAGVDLVSYIGSNAAVRINLVSGVGLGGDAQGDSLSGFENVEGSLFDDFIWGDSGANIISGFAGNDYLVGYGGADRIDGGEGNDTVDYSNSDAKVEINLKDIVFAGGHAQGDELVNVENIIGSDFDDIIQGNGSDNQLMGGKGNDILVGFGGANHLDGGDGVDTVRYTTSAHAVTVDLRSNSGLGGDATGDRIVNVENIIGSHYSDHLIGDGGVNYLYGGAGEDRLEGYAGDDVFIGGAGSDVIYGGEGRDWVNYKTSTAAVIIDLRGALGLGGMRQATSCLMSKM